MGKTLKLCALLFGASLVLGCAAHNGPEDATTPSPANEQQSLEKPAEPASPGIKPVTENHVRKAKKVVSKAKKAIGTPYVYGGSRPGGFDCSGLVKWAYNSVGVALPRTAREQSEVGWKIKNVEDMREGDIVAFRHPRRGYHTGIYVGDGKFIHSPRKRSHVRINSLSEPYFNGILLGARRVVLGETSNVLAQAESRLEEYFYERGELKTSVENAAAIEPAAPEKARSKVAGKKKAAKNKVAATAGNSKKAKASAKSTASSRQAKNTKSVAKAKNAKTANAKSAKSVAAVKNAKSAKSVAAVKNAKSAKSNSKVKTNAKAQPAKNASKTVAAKGNAKSSKAAVASSQNKKKVSQNRS